MLAASRGVVFTQGLSASELFRRMACNVHPVPAMLAAAAALKSAGVVSSPIPRLSH